MFYTTFPLKNKDIKHIDFLELIINNNDEFDYTTKTVNLITYTTVQTTKIPPFIHNFYTKNATMKESLLIAMKNLIERNEFSENKDAFYRKFSIPKRKGGWRHLIEPTEELKLLQQQILGFLSNILNIRPYHAAHAFEPGKDAYTNADVHRDSDYIIKYDFKDFFPSINKDLLKEKLSQISQIYMLGEEFITYLIEIATYEDVLPQGSPLSPYLSNLIMTEFDFLIHKNMKKGIIPKYKYSRYADDLTFSAKTPGKFKELTQGIQQILENEYKNAIELNNEKTKILKITGKCFVTGVKINKDHQLTYGHEKKSELKHEICNMLIKFQNNSLSKEEAQSIMRKNMKAN